MIAKNVKHLTLIAATTGLLMFAACTKNDTASTSEPGNTVSQSAPSQSQTSGNLAVAPSAQPNQAAPVTRPNENSAPKAEQH